jgi:hypothetical protein
MNGSAKRWKLGTGSPPSFCYSERRLFQVHNRL